MHLKRFEIEPTFLADLLTEDTIQARPAWAVTRGIPAGAQLIQVTIDAQRFPGVVSLIFEHPDFVEVEPGQYILPSTAEVTTFLPLPSTAIAHFEKKAS